MNERVFWRENEDNMDIIKGHEMMVKRVMTENETKRKEMENNEGGRRTNVANHLN